jgi:hypothetical protein
VSRKVLIDDDASQMQAVQDRLRRLENPYLPTVTSLPTEVSDGQEVLYRFTQSVTPADAAVIVWRLRWDKTAAAWLPVGNQTPIYALQSANEAVTVSAGTWSGVSANDPLINVPRSGDYEVEWGCGQFWINAVGNWYIAAYFPGSEQTVNGTQPTSDIAAVPGTGTWGGGRATKKMTLAATNQLKQRYYSTVAGTLTRGSAFIKAYPRRITG